jgi:hypothetical protein
MVDMSPQAVTQRLREACKPVERGPEAERSPEAEGSKVPMDPASVTARLRSVSELRDLCLRLARGRVV